MTTTEQIDTFKVNLESSAKKIRRGLSGRALLGTLGVLLIILGVCAAALVVVRIQEMTASPEVVQKEPKMERREAMEKFLALAKGGFKPEQLKGVKLGRGNKKDGKRSADEKRWGMSRADLEKRILRLYKGGTGLVKIGKTLGVGTGLVQRVITEQPRPFAVDVAETYS